MKYVADKKIKSCRHHQLWLMGVYINEKHDKLQQERTKAKSH